VFYISFVWGEDPYYFLADTDDVLEASRAWYDHLMATEAFEPFHSCGPETVDAPVLLDGESNVWHVDLYRPESDGVEDDLILGFAFGPVEIKSPPRGRYNTRARRRRAPAPSARSSAGVYIASFDHLAVCPARVSRNLLPT